MHGPADSELRARVHAAEEALRARDDFLAVAAHELRSPLNALALRLAALERLAAGSADDRLRLELGKTRRMVDRYVRRAVVLLDVSRLQAPDLQPTLVPVDVRSVVDDVVDAHRDEAAFRGATLEAQLEGELEGCWDAHMIEQILSNLVSNAIKYGQGTPVRVRAFPCATGAACFEVSDQGPGIPPEEQARIFGKFERLVSATSDRAGFGLGLWIVARMVAAHQGRIEVRSQPGAGTVFSVMLPLVPDTARAKDDPN